jgi:peroxiredoxin
MISLWRKLAVTAFCAGFLGWSSVSLAQQQKGPLSPVDRELLEMERIEAPSIVLQAADFEGQLLSGGTFQLREQRGKVVFLNFWATWCAPCLKEMPDMQELQAELEDEIVVLAVGMGEDAERITKFQRKHNFQFAILPDPEMEVTQLYGVRNIPITYLIDPKGVVIGRALGPREWTKPALVEFFREQASQAGG